MFERKHERLLSRCEFVLRMLKAVGVGLVIVAASVGIGALGYHFFERMSWVDSVYDATMILTGMGPAYELKTTGGKMFATGYALFSGLVFLTAGGLVLTPMFHRVLHRFHAEVEGKDRKAG